MVYCHVLSSSVIRQNNGRKAMFFCHVVLVRVYDRIRGDKSNGLLSRYSSSLYDAG